MDNKCQKTTTRTALRVVWAMDGHGVEKYQQIKEWSYVVLFLEPTNAAPNTVRANYRARVGGQANMASHALGTRFR
jgi:hypothetical protein